MSPAAVADFQVGDLVQTPMGLRYRVVRLRPHRPLVICEPLSQPHWKTHFAFPPACLTRIEAQALDSAADDGRWVRVPWSLWTHAVDDDRAGEHDRRRTPRTLCRRDVGPEMSIDSHPADRCAVCRTRLEIRAAQAAAESESAR